jgi:hypothetical protein
MARAGLEIQSGTEDVGTSDRDAAALERAVARLRLENRRLRLLVETLSKKVVKNKGRQSQQQH